jgi:hypothetical protein
MIAASPKITRYRIVFTAAYVFPSFDDHHETEPSRLFLPTENPEAPFFKGGLGGFHLRAWLSSQHRHCYLNSPLLESPSCLAEVFDVGGSQAVAWRRRLRAPPFRVGSWTKALPASGGMLYLTALPNSMLMKALLYEVRTFSSGPVSDPALRGS